MGQDCHKKMEKTPNEFAAEAQCDFLTNSTSRLLTVTCSAVEKKFKTKLTKVKLSMPREAWMEYKRYRVRLWKAGNNWKGTEKDEEDEKKKDGEKKRRVRSSRRSRRPAFGTRCLRLARGV